ncbi:hypothetical protein ADIARSV_0868 [Arcticibacter svalbardensis MN12-7]|uniref:Rhamnogalacturonase A/B/Epimerase-like pectate lyase domain-containing protein n=1 Tax=Arcticibacter svalbardensis MN12-7 TaxID=1150600 RepID=R9GWC9_9SPHI|nr:glycosyl hydrolase family 28-related protein [Arcticibacter svalbardensis]EOR95978.1 hypothetical protein ADIARSV_0868 [Arcticibacter svalbardensis MN12-7]
MKRIILIVSIFAIISSCKQDADLQPATTSPISAETVSATSNVKGLGITNDGKSDQQSKIQALIGSNKTLFFPKGTYLISKSLDIKNITNLKIYGEAGTIFVSPTNKIITLLGNAYNIEISSITFKSTRVSTVNDAEGLIFIAAFGANDLMDGININKCTFTNPESQGNGIKLVSEGTNSMVKYISVANNRFESIGRMAIEFQNHANQNVARFKDFYIHDNYFFDIGTIQSGPAPSCVSVSGYSTNGQINNNEFYNMRMKSSPFIYYGIENAGTIGLETNNNYFHSDNYGFTGILGSAGTKSNWTISNNVFELTGSTSDKNKIRGIEINDAINFTITNNKITTDGMAMMLVNCRSGKISGNTGKVKVGNAFYARAGSIKNTITKNTFNTSLGPDNGVVLFDGSATNGNSASANTLIGTGNKVGKYVNVNGAYNNY